MKYESKIQWKEYPQHKPESRGRYMVISDGVVGVGYYSKFNANWKEVFGHDMGLPSSVTHWAHFPDAVPVQIETEQFDETPDEYIGRLVKEAAPAWEGVDPDKFMDEVRGRTAGLEWKKGAPQEDGAYIIARVGQGGGYTCKYHPAWRTQYPHNEPAGVLCHFGPIPYIPFFE